MAYETLDETEWNSVDRVWELLDEGKTEEARAALASLMARRPAHPDLQVVDAAVCLEEGEPAAALAALGGAERSADPALFFHLRAAGHFELAQLAEARDDAERALAVNPDVPETHSLLSRALELLGDAQRADEHARLANQIDPERFPLPLDVSDAEFDALVAASLRELPPEVRKHLEELPVLVEDHPRPEVLRAETPPISPDVLGLFVGRHLLDRSHTDLPGTPGAIYLFRRNLLRVCRDRAELAEQVRITVRHEVAHLLGADEDTVGDWGLA